MGRSNAGKKQEEATLKANQAQQQADIGGRDKSLASYGKSVDSLEATPGYSPEDMAAMRARNGALIGATYLGAEDSVKRSAAAAGHENDVGLAPWMANLARDKAMMETGRNLDYIQDNAQQKLDTRRMIPGMRYQPAALYQSSYSGIGNNNTSLINGRMEQDSKPTFLQQLALAGVSAAGQAASGNLGCWIAEAIWGVDDHRTLLVREWLNEEYAKSLVGGVVMVAYLRFGRAVAAFVRKHPLAKRALKPLFNEALARARGWKLLSEAFA